MKDAPGPSPSIVVGIDGSRTAVTAALWAADEAVDRDIPLRLIYAIEPSAGDRDPQDAARRLATAEIAVRHVFATVESTNKPVKIELEILQGRPAAILAQASYSAAMICLGAIGLKHGAVGGVGSTAATLASAAHCPVAIIRSYEPAPATPLFILAELDESPSSANVLEAAISEARLRKAPLRVITTWQSRFTDIHDARAVTDGNRRARAQLDRRLAWWRRKHPGLAIESVTAHCSTLNYLTHHAADVQLVVVGRERTSGVADVAGPRVELALHDTHCSVLVCKPYRAL